MSKLSKTETLLKIMNAERVDQVIRGHKWKEKAAMKGVSEET